MKALIEMVLGKKNVAPINAAKVSQNSGVEYASNKLREKLAEKRMREEKLASQYGHSS